MPVLFALLACREPIARPFVLTTRVERRLENGVRLHVVRDPTAPTLAVAVEVDVGSGDAPPETPELAHLVEHLLFRCGPDHPLGWNGVFRTAEALGADRVGAWTSATATVYSADIPPASLAAWAALEAQRFGAPRLDGLDDEERVLALERAEADRDERARVALLGAALPDHPLGNRARVGRPATLAEAHAFLEAAYVPSALTVRVRGPVGDDALDVLSAAFSTLAASDRPPLPPPPPVVPPLGGRRTVGPPRRAGIAWVTPAARTREEQVALDVAARGLRALLPDWEVDRGYPLVTAVRVCRRPERCRLEALAAAAALQDGWTDERVRELLAERPLPRPRGRVGPEDPPAPPTPPRLEAVRRAAALLAPRDAVVLLPRKPPPERAAPRVAPRERYVGPDGDTPGAAAIRALAPVPTGSELAPWPAVDVSADGRRWTMPSAGTFSARLTWVDRPDELVCEVLEELAATDAPPGGVRVEVNCGPDSATLVVDGPAADPEAARRAVDAVRDTLAAIEPERDADLPTEDVVAAALARLAAPPASAELTGLGNAAAATDWLGEGAGQPPEPEPEPADRVLLRAGGPMRVAVAIASVRSDDRALWLIYDRWLAERTREEFRYRAPLAYREGSRVSRGSESASVEVWASALPSDPSATAGALVAVLGGDVTPDAFERVRHGARLANTTPPRTVHDAHLRSDDGTDPRPELDRAMADLTLERFAAFVAAIAASPRTVIVPRTVDPVDRAAVEAVALHR